MPDEKGRDLLDINVLGSPRVTRDGTPVEVDTRKAIATLAYLTVEHSADRDLLAGLFWADSPADRARAALRRTLSALRGGIGGEAIRADRHQVVLVEGFTSDIEGFETRISETAGHGHDPKDVCPDCIGPLEQAADLYRGDFLGAFSVRDAPEFEDWARSVTERYRLKAGEVFRRLAMARASVGDYDGAISTARRWIHLDDLHEPAHRLTMLLQAWAGDRAGAIQAYQDCVAVLDRELGVAPLEETTELFEAILDEDLPPSPGVRKQVKAHVRPASAPYREMIDRTAAIATLESLFEIARPGVRLAMLSGASWMGKTTLLEHILDGARDRPGQVLVATAYRSETGLPYGVAVQLLNAVGSTVHPPNAAPSWVLDELHRLDPGLAPHHETPDAGLLGQTRLREAYLAMFELAATATELTLAIDDIHWIDPASAELIAVLRRRMTGRMNMIISARDFEEVHPVLREMASDADVNVHLVPLRSEDLGDLAADVDIERIIESTGGIPLLVKEAIDSGGVQADSSTVLRYMESRRHRLSELGLQLLATTSVIGGMCDAALLKDTSGRNEEEVVETVEELISAGLLREHADGRLSFTLDVLGSLTYDSTSLVRRRLLHRRAAEALSARARSQSDPRLATAIGEHLQAAGSDEAAVWYRRAGDLSREVFANEEATSSYETAIALGHPDPGAIRLALGELAMARGDYDTAMRELRTAASHSSGPTFALVEHRMGDLLRMLGRFELAEESFMRAEPDHPSPADLYSAWALLRHRTGDSANAVELANRAAAAARSAGDDRDLSRALNILGVVSTDPVVAAGHIDAALELAGANDPLRMAALNNRAHLLASEGRLDEAVDSVGEAIAIAARTGFRHHQAALLDHLADLHHQAGRDDEAAAALTEAVTLFADVGTGDWEPEVWLLRQW